MEKVWIKTKIYFNVYVFVFLLFCLAKCFKIIAENSVIAIRLPTDFKDRAHHDDHPLGKYAQLKSGMEFFFT